MERLDLSLTALVRPSPVEHAGPPPTLVLLHGYGSNEMDLMGLAPYLDPRLQVISVRAPVRLDQGGFAWFPLEFGPQGLIHDPAAVEEGLRRLEAYLEELASARGLSPDRTFLGGFSQGAAAALGYTLAHPDRIAGAVVMSGMLAPGAAPAEVAPGPLRGKPILVTHGTEDPLVTIDCGRAIRDFLSALPVDLTYREYAMAHEVSQQSLADARAWLAARLDDLLSSGR